MVSSRIAAALAFAVAALTAGWASGVAAQSELHVARAPERVRVDGMLRDWDSVPMTTLAGSGGVSMQYAVAYGGKGLYVIARVHDRRVVRTRHPGRHEDAVVLTLAWPSRKGLHAVEVWLYPGIAGHVSAAAGVASIGGRPRPIRGARVVEGPLRSGSGYALEAFVPLSAIGAPSDWERGRGAIRLHDVDSEAHPEVVSEPASASVSARALDRIPALVVEGSSSELLRQFLAAKGLAGVHPRADLTGDVAGDGRPERVVLIDRYVVVVGPGFRSGKSYDFFQLPVASGGDVQGARLVDLTGDGKDELTVRFRQRDERGSRDLWMVLGIGSDAIRPMWAVETRKETQSGWVEDRVTVRRRRGGPPIIAVRAEKAKGLDASNYHEAAARDARPILLPWGPVLERRYRWDGARFAVLDEKANPRYEPPEPTSAPRATARPAPRAPRTAPAPTVAQMLAMVRQQRAVPAGTPARFEQDADIAEDSRREHLVVYGDALVVVGPGFRGGQGYFYYQLPVSDPQDVLGVQTSDLTGDGTREVLLRIRQRFEQGVTREVLLAYCFHGNDFHRILALEIERAQGANEVRNRWKLVRAGRKHDIVVSPGVAKGWDAASWPFADGNAEDGVQPLLLPWRDRPARYGYVAGPGLSSK